MRPSPPGEADVAIAGAGILGCSIAWHILRLRRETRVVVIDRQRAVAINPEVLQEKTRSE